jgi:hypothetical protein
MITLYGTVRVLKFLAVLTYACAGTASLVSVDPGLRKRAVHRIASPALLAIWAAGFTLAWLRGTSFHELWLLGGLALSFGATLVLMSAAGGKPQGRKALAAFALQLALAITLMALRPKWSSFAP